MRLLKFALLLTFILISTPSSAEKKSPMSQPPLPVTICQNIYSYLNYKYFYKRPAIVDRPVNLLSDYEYMKEQKEISHRGKMASVIDEEFDTRVYYTATARPKADGTIPVVDPEAKALYIFLHGSGTQKAGGVTFSYKANSLANMGYAGLSIDLPFHKEGSTNPDLVFTEKFMKYLDGVIQKYRVPGQPVYLAGHSFGPDLVAEYLRRYPHGVDGAALISPAAYNKELQDYFANVTSKATRFWGDTKPNRDGGRWGGVVTSTRTWTSEPTEKSPDPTVVNPNLKVRVTIGDHDEYFPGKLDEHGEPTKEPRDYDPRPDFNKVMKNAEVIIEPGVGHYIFAHNDKHGHDVVLREFLALNGETLDNEKALKAQFRDRKFSNTELAMMRYEKEPFFRAWADKEAGGREGVFKAFQDGDQKTAQNMIKNFNIAMNQRQEALYENLRKTAWTRPLFYRANKEDIDKLGSKGFDASPVLSRYADYLETQTPGERNRFASAPATTLTVTPSEDRQVAQNEQGGDGQQKRKGPPDLTPEKLEQQRKAKEQKLKDKEERKRKAEEKAKQTASLDSNVEQKQAVGE